MSILKFILICVAMVILGGVAAMGMFSYVFSEMMHALLNGL